MRHRPHGGEQRAAARCQRDTLCDDLFHGRNRQPLEQRDALAQRGLERDFAAHRAFGDRRDVRLQPDIVRKLVDALLLDDGRIHVGDEQPLAPARERLHHDVDGVVLQGGTQPHRDRFVVRAARRKGNVGGDAGVEHAHVLCGASTPTASAIAASSSAGCAGLEMRVAT